MSKKHEKEEVNVQSIVEELKREKRGDKIEELKKAEEELLKKSIPGKSRFSLCKEKEIRLNAKFLDPRFDDLLGWDIEEEEPKVRKNGLNSEMIMTVI